MMTLTLTERQREEIHALFHMLDTDKDGLIHIKDVFTLLRALGQNPTSVELKEIEENNEEYVNCTSAMEIIDKFGLKSQEQEEEELKIAFRAIDRDNSGTISKDELKFYLCRVGEQMSAEEVDELMEMSDLNKDGVIDYQEFIAIMAAHIM